MSPIAEVVINLIAEHPVASALALSSVVVLGGCWFGFGAVLDQLDERRDRQAEAARRQADLDTCNAILKLPSPRKETP